jgi:hypothetical protein
MSATVDYLERQAAALLELIEKKDDYIIRLQEEVSQKSSLAHTLRAEQNNFRNTVREYVIEALKNDDISMSVAESLSEICDFELSKTITITGTVDYQIEVTIPLDADPDDVIASLEYSVDAFDYSIDDFSCDSRNVDWEETIS